MWLSTSELLCNIIQGGLADTRLSKQKKTFIQIGNLKMLFRNDVTVYMENSEVYILYK